jgi:hypothetical protein
MIFPVFYIVTSMLLICYDKAIIHFSAVTLLLLWKNYILIYDPLILTLNIFSFLSSSQGNVKGFSTEIIIC